VQKPIGNLVLEALVTQAYVQLVHVAWEDQFRIASIWKYGDYEVRLVERLIVNGGDMPNLWVELYSKHENATIDSCSCDDLDAAMSAAEHLMDQARQLLEVTQTSVKPLDDELESAR
jgi:hypothetical protein